MAKKIYFLFLILFLSFNLYADQHTIKIKINNPNSDSDYECYHDSSDNKWCQVYLEIPAKLYMDKGWLREDLKNLRFNDGSRDLTYWVIPKEDGNYHINKHGLWLLIPDLQTGVTYIDMIIDGNSSTSYCNPRATTNLLSDDRSSYRCAASVFPFYSYNLYDWKLTKYPSYHNWYDPDTIFINNTLYDPDTIWPGKRRYEAKTGNEFTLHIDNMKYYAPSGSYDSEAKIYFLSQAPPNRPEELENSDGYRLYIEKAYDFNNVSDNLHYTRVHFKIKLQLKEGIMWLTKAETDWYPYNNTRHVFDIKVSSDKIALYINGKHVSFTGANGGSVDNGDFIREDSFNSGFFGIDRMGWRLCCGTDINYIMLRNYYKEEPDVEVYGNTDVIVGKGTADRGEDLIEIVPDIQLVGLGTTSAEISGNTLDKYVFAKLNIARENQIINDFKLKIKNRGDSDATFNIIQHKIADNPSDWLVYWCDESGENCSISHPDTISIESGDYKEYTLKVIPSPSVLFNGGSIKVKVNVVCNEDGSFDNAEFRVNVLTKLGCYWKYKLPISINWSSVHGYDTLYDYQVLVNIKNMTELQYANEDGSDIIVTDSSGNILPFWIKNFDYNGRNLSLWVKTQSISGSDNNTIYIWWGNKEYRTTKSDIYKTFDLFEDWHEYNLGQTVGCPDGTAQCSSASNDLSGWKNVPTPDDYYNWWIIKELPSGNKILNADIYRDGSAIDIHNGLCGYSDGDGKSCDKGPYLFGGSKAWDHYEVYYKMNAGPYCQYSGCENPWGNPQYNPVYVLDAGNMWGIEFFADKFIYRPYASGIDYTWQYQTYPRNILGERFPERNQWYWVKVRVYREKDTGMSDIEVWIAKDEPQDIDNNTYYYEVGYFNAPPVFDIPFGKMGFGGWDSGFYFDDVRVRKYINPEPTCSHGNAETLSPRENISLSQPQITPPFFEGRSAYIFTRTKPFSWLGDLIALDADCYIGDNCTSNQDKDKEGTLSVFGKINDNVSKGLGFFLMTSLPNDYNRTNIEDENWIQNGRFILTRIDNKTTHDFNGFDKFDLTNCSYLKDLLLTTGTCTESDNYTDETEKLIKFVRGFYISDYSKSNGRNMDSDPLYGNNNGTAEDNEQWKLGDILHSNPLIVGIPNMLYGDTSYSKFVTDHRNRELVFYFMSNDGMLHAFRVAEFDNYTVINLPRYKPVDPIELWAFIPEVNLPKLKNTTEADHHYIADGLLRAIDVKDGDRWKTILMGISGRESEYIFAIDITDPADPEFLWELNKYKNPGLFDKLGTAISAPGMGKLNVNGNEKWVAIFGSGFSNNFISNYTEKKAYLTIIDILNGEVIKQIKVNDKIGNVLTDISPLRDKNGNLLKIFFGDYYGALWKVTNERLSELITKDNPELDEDDMLFKPYDYDNPTSPSEVKRPITVYPIIAKGEGENDWWIYFGTGDYDEYDPNYPYQRFYGIKDSQTTYTDAENCDNSTPTCGDFVNVTSSNQTNINKESWVIELGHTDTMDVIYSDYKECYNNCVDSGTDADICENNCRESNKSIKGRNERVIQPATVFGKMVFFTTYEPENNPCGGGLSRFYAVNYTTGTVENDLFLIGGANDSSTTNNSFTTLRSIQLSTKGIPSKALIYTGHGGKSKVVASGLINSSTGVFEKVNLNPGAFINNIDILLWRRIK